MIDFKKKFKERFRMKRKIFKNNNTQINQNSDKQDTIL